MNTQEVKAGLRQELKNLREALSLAQRENAASNAELKIIDLPEWKRAKVVCLYASFKEELPTLQFLQKVLATEKKCVLPKVNSQGEPELYIVENFRDLELSPLEILEPKKNCTLISPAQIDFFLVPGIGFDRLGHRLGHGSGFYDRLLSQANPSAFFLGYCYDFQVVPAIPFEAHDIGMHAVVTPTQIIYIKPA